MSRFGELQEQFRDNSKLWSSHWSLLEGGVKNLSRDFGKWLAQNGPGQTDSGYQPVPVEVLSRSSDNEGEEIFGYDLSAGQMHQNLNFVFRIELSEEKQAHPASAVMLRLTIGRSSGYTFVIIADTGCSHRYNSQVTPEKLFDELFAICQKVLDDKPI